MNSDYILKVELTCEIDIGDIEGFTTIQYQLNPVLIWRGKVVGKNISLYHPGYNDKNIWEGTFMIFDPEFIKHLSHKNPILASIGYIPGDPNELMEIMIIP